jgi:hypothetical protein
MSSSSIEKTVVEITGAAAEAITGAATAEATAGLTNVAVPDPGCSDAPLNIAEDSPPAI